MNIDFVIHPNTNGGECPCGLAATACIHVLNSLTDAGAALCFGHAVQLANYGDHGVHVN